jgi:hypothetical protein
VTVYEQGDAAFVNREPRHVLAASFREAHGPSVASIGFLVDDAKLAFEVAVARGARPYDGTPTGAPPSRRRPSTASAGASSTSSTGLAPRRHRRRDLLRQARGRLVRRRPLRDRPPHEQRREGRAGALGEVLRRGVRLHRRCGSFDIVGAKTGLVLVRAPLAGGSVLHPHQRGQGRRARSPSTSASTRAPASSTSRSRAATCSRRSTRMANRSPCSTSTRPTTKTASPRAWRPRGPEAHRGAQRARRRRRRGLPAPDLHEELHRPHVLRAHPAREPPLVRRRATSARSSARSSAIRSGAA